MEEMVTIFEKLQGTYSGKRVFLTGHTGFKGSWLLKVLSMIGAEVKGFSLPPKRESDLYNLIQGDSLCNSVIADLRDQNRLLSEIVSFKPDYVFHLAAQPLVRLSYEAPKDTFEVNSLGTAYLLEAIRSLKNKCSVVLITTDKVYHNYEWIYPYRESDRLGGYDPYSASKACSELIIDSYRSSFFNLDNYVDHQKSIAVARAGNVIGGGDWSEDRLLPDIINSFRQNQVLTLRNPKAIRPWQHVLEPLFGYLLLGLKCNESPLEFSQPFNFGPRDSDVLSVDEIVKLALLILGRGSYQCDKVDEQPHEAQLLKLDISKSMSVLGWCPLLSSYEAVKLTIDWYKIYLEGKEDIVSITENTIKNFWDKKYV